MRLEKRFYWKQLIEGLLLDPVSNGPYWNAESLNGDGDGYASEEEAVADFAVLNEKYPQGELVLITCYAPVP